MGIVVKKTSILQFWKKNQLGRKVGFRYLVAKKNSSFLSLITLISIGGVAVGVATMIVTLSVMSGFEQELKHRLFESESHVQIEGLQSLAIDRSTISVSDLKAVSPAIKEVTPVLQTEIILRVRDKLAGGVIKGVESLDWIKKQVVEWDESGGALAESSAQTRSEESEVDRPESASVRPSLPELYIGQEMALNTGITVGDIVTLVSPVETSGPLGAIPRTKKFFVKGLYRSGVPEQELHVVFTHLSNVESFLRKTNVLTHIELKVDSLESAPVVADLVKKKLSSRYLVRSWQDLNMHLFYSLKLERICMFCILVFIVIVASFNIISTLMMMIIEKKRSLSILRTMGATRQQIASVFFWEGIAIALLGTFVGTGLGLLLCEFLQSYPIIELPDFYYDRTLPVVIQPLSILLIILSSIVIVLLGAVLPARRASLLTPLQGIRES